MISIRPSTASPSISSVTTSAVTSTSAPSSDTVTVSSTITMSSSSSSMITTTSSGSRMPSGEPSAIAWSSARYAGATAEISARTSLKFSKPRSVPSRLETSAASIQSAREVPGGVTRCESVLTRPSMFVVVPVFSAKPAAASTTSARLLEELSAVSTASTVRAPVRPRSARSASGKSESGSAPKRTRTSMRPSAAARRMPSVSRPVALGVAGQTSEYHSAPSSRVTRPGRSPGARPMSSAPRTLDRRNAERNVVSGRALRIAEAAATVMLADSASDARPSTTVIGPVDAERAARACSSSSAETPAISRSMTDEPTSAATTSAVSPGRGCTDAAASEVIPLERGETSTMVTRSSTAA